MPVEGGDRVEDEFCVDVAVQFGLSEDMEGSDIYLKELWNSKSNLDRNDGSVRGSIVLDKT